MTGMVRDFTADTEIMAAAAGSGYSTATDLADWLVQNLNVPFREAHHVTARIVKAAAGNALETLSLAQMQAVEPRITDEVFGMLSAEASARSRTSFGGTAPEQVRQAVSAAKQTLKE